MINTFVTIDGTKYGVVQGSYLRQWVRSFTSYLAANIVRLNFVDKGPGVRTYTMQLMLGPFNPGSLLSLAGVSNDAFALLASLDASYAKVATPINFTDPFGNVSSFGVYFTDLQVSVPNYSTSQTPYIMATVQLTEATQTVN